jgi:hypothetical protein
MNAPKAIAIIDVSPIEPGISPIVKSKIEVGSPKPFVITSLPSPI